MFQNERFIYLKVDTHRCVEHYGVVVGAAPKIITIVLSEIGIEAEACIKLVLIETAAGTEAVVEFLTVETVDEGRPHERLYAHVFLQVDVIAQNGGNDKGIVIIAYPITTVAHVLIVGAGLYIERQLSNAEIERQSYRCGSQYVGIVVRGNAHTGAYPHDELGCVPPVLCLRAQTQEQHHGQCQ